MKIPRLSVGWMMILVALVAVDFAGLPAAIAYDPGLGAGVIPAAILLEFAVLRFVDTKDKKKRAFLTGFFICGLLMTLSFVIGRVFCGVTNYVSEIGTGKSRLVVTVPPRFGGDWMGTIWNGYFRYATDLGRGILPNSRYTFGVLACLPQLFAAILGGYVALLISESTDLRSRDKKRELIDAIN